MDGDVAAEIWRGEEEENEFPPLPILAWSANEDPEIQEQCLEHGMTDFMKKGISLENFRKCIQKHIPRPTLM
jgi:two-component system sensor histidine kinase EvgS